MGHDNTHHGHDHSHQHGHDDHHHDHSLTDQNRDHWDKVANEYTRYEWQKDLVRRLDQHMTEHIDWIGVPFKDPSAFKVDDRQVRVLDYACGPGTVTSILARRATSYTGLDLSSKMVEAYNARFNHEVFFTAKAEVCNLFTPEGVEKASGPEYFDFDLVVVGMGFHHFQDLPHVTKTLVERVKPGGVLLITDLMAHEVIPEYEHIIAHSGFSFEGIKKLFEDAGLIDVDWKVMDGVVQLGGPAGDKGRKIFMARGRKPERASQ